MKKGLLFLLSLACVIQVAAQRKEYFSVVQGVSATSGSFPEFYQKRAKKASKNINEYLQLSLNKTIINTGTDSATANNWAYTIPVNNQKLLSLSVLSSEGAKGHFLFNAATGSIISIQDIYTVNGIAYIKRQMLKHYQQQSKNNLLPEQIEGKEKCIKSDIQNFLITEDTLIIFPDHCFDTDSTNETQTRVAFSTAYLGQYLSEYGQVMFGVRNKPKLKKLSSSGIAGLYQGAIENEAVLLQLDAPFEKSLSGTLYFTQSKKSVPFEGNFKSNRIDISNGNDRLTLNIFPGTINGQRKSGNKVLSNFTLTRQ